MIKKREKLKLTQYIQIYRNNDLLLLNLVNKYVLSDLLKLELSVNNWSNKLEDFIAYLIQTSSIGDI